MDAELSVHRATDFVPTSCSSSIIQLLSSVSTLRFTAEAAAEAASRVFDTEEGASGASVATQRCNMAIFSFQDFSESPTAMVVVAVAGAKRRS